MEDKVLLRVARAIVGLEQHELAQLFGYHRSYIWCMEDGRRPLSKPIKAWVEEVVFKFLEHYHNNAIKLLENAKNNEIR